MDSKQAFVTTKSCSNKRSLSKGSSEGRGELKQNR